jgi:hypothetical protein
MDIRIEGEVIERLTNGRVISFKIKADDNTYRLSNCSLGNTEQHVFEAGVECYTGNIDITDDGIVKTILATLWVRPNNECVCVYQQ